MIFMSRFWQKNLPWHEQKIKKQNKRYDCPAQAGQLFLTYIPNNPGGGLNPVRVY